MTIDVEISARNGRYRLVDHGMKAEIGNMSRTPAFQELIRKAGNSGPQIPTPRWRTQLAGTEAASILRKAGSARLSDPAPAKSRKEHSMAQLPFPFITELTPTDQIRVALS